MHEFALAAQLLAAVLDTTHQAPALHVEEVHVRVGSLTGVLPDALRFGFDALAAGTPAAGARLILHEDVASMQCIVCKAQTPAPLPLPLLCESCGGRLVVRGGRDLLLERVVLSGHDPDDATRESCA